MSVCMEKDNEKNSSQQQCQPQQIEKNEKKHKLWIKLESSAKNTHFVI